MRISDTEGIWIDPSLFPLGEDAMVQVVVFDQREKGEVWSLRQFRTET